MTKTVGDQATGTPEGRTSLPGPLQAKLARLLTLIGEMKSCAVAFSGGVDSSVVARAAYEALGDRAVAFTAVSPSVAEGEMETARQVAGLIGIQHEVIETREFDQSAYTRNAPDRCYHCKTELYTQMEPRARAMGLSVMINGANADDLGDYRPGMRAAAQRLVRSPLAECQVTKPEVRQLAAAWQLPVWDKPASPCLSSRVAYGEEVTPQRLRMIDRAEQFLRTEGFSEVRVRYHRGDLARVEVPADRVGELLAPERRDRVIRTLGQLGFRFVTVDLEGFRSGSLNSLVPIDALNQTGRA